MQNYISLELSNQTLRTSYFEAGKKSSPTMLFVHGNSSSKETFLRQIQSFKSSYHVVAVDLPGHGETEKFQKADYSLELLSEFLILFVKELGLEVNTLFGHSLGGHICLQSINIIKPIYLITWGSPPLTNPPVMEKIFAPIPCAAYFFRNEVHDQNLQELYEACYENRTAQGFIDFSNNFRETDQSFREGFFSEFTNFNFKDEFNELEKFEGRTLFLYGLEEKLINKEYLFENCFEHRIHPIESAGHFTHQDNFDDFNIYCLAFITNRKNNINMNINRERN
ncbi:MAG: pimeloyl-ACP methyl ester carboxylesterase [Bacteriovoracaceae bacterium]|jgi:pimeloyl-ACP methyl ester carboxylesterase